MALGFRDPLGDGGITISKDDADGFYALRVFLKLDTDGSADAANGLRHLGTDWNAASDENEIAHASYAGTVAYASVDAGSNRGGVVMLNHVLPNGEKYTTVYMHLEHIPAGILDGSQTTVVSGEVLGDSGLVKVEWGLHVHFEVREGHQVGLVGVGKAYFGGPGQGTLVSSGIRNGIEFAEIRNPEGNIVTYLDPLTFVENNRELASLFTSNDDVVSLREIGGQFDALGGHDRVIGSSSAETVHGNTGDDVIFDGNGNDFIYGDQDNDYLSATGTKDNDLFDGGSGVDMVSYANLNDKVTIDLSKQTAKGKLVGSDTLVSIENGQGSQGDDTIIGNNNRNILDGREGKDTLKGGGGDDDLVGLKGNDTLIGGAGIDTARYDYDHDGNGAFTGIVADLKTGKVKDTTNNIDTLKEIESISGSIFADVIKGNSKTNELSGHDGEDYLAGRGGNDFLSGGADADHFVFTDKLNANTNVDTIRDFMHLQDDLYLSKTIFKKVGALLDGSEFRLGNFAQDSDDYIIYDQANGLLYYDANGSAAGGQTLFAKFNPGTALTVDDFSII